MHNYSIFDRAILEFDRGLRTLTKKSRTAQRDNPANNIEEAELSNKQQELAARLMRVNHAGEIAAQGLYHGQALTARDESTIQAMQQSADEEEDHLAWCEERLTELQNRPSLLSPFWYMGSYTLGATAGLFGDRWSLGFVNETEKQVEQHLTRHLEKLPEQDNKSRAILEKMRDDENHTWRKSQTDGRRRCATTD